MWWVQAAGWVAIQGLNVWYGVGALAGQLAFIPFSPAYSWAPWLWWWYY